MNPRFLQLVYGWVHFTKSVNRATIIYSFGFSCSDFHISVRMGGLIMARVLVAGASDVNPGEMKKFDVSGTDVLIANIDGTFYAIANTCTHMGGSLADGILENGIVKCPRHGARYDVKTGECVGELSFLFVKKMTKGVQAFFTEIKDGQLYIEI
jgi:3-phenylpropionate/trans-cinnamate dioxygenase ferredoxin component